MWSISAFPPITISNLFLKTFTRIVFSFILIIIDSVLILIIFIPISKVLFIFIFLFAFIIHIQIILSSVQLNWSYIQIVIFSILSFDYSFIILIFISLLIFPFIDYSFITFISQFHFTIEFSFHLESPFLFSFILLSISTIHIFLQFIIWNVLLSFSIKFPFISIPIVSSNVYLIQIFSIPIPFHNVSSS
jgi:hypothetical protein